MTFSANALQNGRFPRKGKCLRRTRTREAHVSHQAKDVAHTVRVAQAKQSMNNFCVFTFKSSFFVTTFKMFSVKSDQIILHPLFIKTSSSRSFSPPANGSTSLPPSRSLHLDHSSVHCSFFQSLVPLVPLLTSSVFH